MSILDLYWKSTKTARAQVLKPTSVYPVATLRGTTRVGVLLPETLKHVLKRIGLVIEELAQNARPDAVHLLEASNIALARLGDRVNQVPIEFREDV